MSSPRRVPSLKYLALHNYIRQTWRRGVAIKYLVLYIYTKNQSLGEIIPNPVKLSKYTGAVYTDILNVVEPKILPESLKIEFKNCYLYLAQSMVQASSDIYSAITLPTLKTIEIFVNNIIITRHGLIDMRNTFIELVFKLPTTFFVNFMSIHCISKDDVMQALERKRSNGEVKPEDLEMLLKYINNTFGDPCQYWIDMQLKDSRKRLLEYIVLEGPVEALEYILPRVEPRERVIELSKAAMTMVKYKFSLPKLLFFYKHMDYHCWVVMLCRNFNTIFQNTYPKTRYANLCITFHNQVRNHISLNITQTTFLYLAQQFIYANHKHNKTITKVHRQEFVKRVRAFDEPLVQTDLEWIFLAIWRASPFNHKKYLSLTIYKMLATFVSLKKYNIIFSILSDEGFDKKDQYKLAYFVAMQIILNENVNSIDEFLNHFQQKEARHEIKRSLVSIDLFKSFVLNDACKNIRKYDALLSTLQIDIQDLKKSIISDRVIVSHAISYITNHHFTLERVELLIKWCFNFNRASVSRYVQDVLIEENLMAKMFLHYLTSTRRSIFSIYSFGLSYAQLLAVRRNIASNRENLFKYCLDLVKTKYFQGLPTMLDCIFENDEERELFLRNFFNTSYGANAVKSLLVQEDYDAVQSRQTFWNKRLMYQSFFKYFVQSHEICSDLQVLVLEYEPPDIASYFANTPELNLLPYENNDNFRSCCENNKVLMKLLLDRLEFEWF